MHSSSLREELPARMRALHRDQVQQNDPIQQVLDPLDSVRIDTATPVPTDRGWIGMQETSQVLDRPRWRHAGRAQLSKRRSGDGIDSFLMHPSLSARSREATPAELLSATGRRAAIWCRRRIASTETEARCRTSTEACSVMRITGRAGCSRLMCPTAGSIGNRFSASNTTASASPASRTISSWSWARIHRRSPATACISAHTLTEASTAIISRRRG